MALTKKESTREGSRMKAQDQKELMRERICDCARGYLKERDMNRYLCGRLQRRQELQWEI